MKIINGVKVKQLKVVSDERGRVMEMLRNDDELFVKFGQVYYTTAYPGIVKGWHYHEKQIDNFIVVKGMAKVVLYDRREDSLTLGEINEFFMGEHHPILIQIPAGVLHGFKCISETEAMVINIPTEPYNRENPDEHRVDPNSDSIPYNWALKEK